MSERPDLNELRKKLDEIDNGILDLFEERIATCRQIGNVKRENGIDVYVPAREEEKFQALEESAGFESRPYVRELFKTLMDISKVHQNKPAFGVLGRTLAHTYSPEIHSLFTSEYSYSVIEREPEELETLFKSGVFKGFNVTIPYKKNACAMCDELDDASRTTGSVNTVLFEDGKVKGWNTDYFGFIYMLTRKGISVTGKKVLVLGTGGAASAVFYALKTLGAAETYACDLETEINYSNVYEKAGDAQVIVNCTPVGMFPKVDNSLLDLTKFASLEACADVVYNPSRTKFLQEAEALGLKTCGGLAMLSLMRWTPNCSPCAFSASLMPSVNMMIDISGPNWVLKVSYSVSSDGKRPRPAPFGLMLRMWLRTYRMSSVCPARAYSSVFSFLFSRQTASVM